MVAVPFFWLLKCSVQATVGRLTTKAYHAGLARSRGFDATDDAGRRVSRFAHTPTAMAMSVMY